MNHLSFFTLVLFFILISQLNGQWFIIKKNYPSQVMNYPNPGKKRSLNDFIVDCSQNFSDQRNDDERTAWLIACRDTASTLFSSVESIENDRRTLRSIPPYFNENEFPFHRRLIDRFQRIYRKK